MTKGTRTALKLIAAGAIVTALLATGRLSLTALTAVMSRPWTLLAMIALQVVILGIGVLRWQVLLSSIAKRRQSFGDLLVYNWIGQFFGTFAPSTVATDVTRFSYVVRSGAAAAPAVLASLVIDRAAGTIGTIALATILAHTLVIDSVSSRTVIIVGVVVTVIAAAIALTRRGREVREAAAAAKGATVFAVACAMAAMALKVLSIWLVVRVVSPLPSFQTVFSVAPVGFLVEAIPIAPGGMGTAHLAFEYLLGSRGIAHGAGVFNVYFVVRLLASIVGGVLWAARNGRVMDQPRDVRTGFGIAILSGPRPRIDDQSPRLHW
jgi:glycosyltransferase 2 family protein